MIRNSKDFEDALEYYLESQKQKHYREGALCTLGYILVGSILEAQKEGEIMLPAESHTNYKKNNNADNFAQTSSGTKTECVGTYPVSGYTRADGTEVSGYTRSCGAAHNGKSKPEKAEPIEEPDYFAENEGYDVLEGRVEKNSSIEKTKEVLRNKSKVYKNYENLESQEILQKAIAKNVLGNLKYPLFDYYKIALDLADKPDKVTSNERYDVYKVKDLPTNFNKDIIYQKMINNMSVNMSKDEYEKKAENTSIIVPKQNSELVKMIKYSDEMKEFLRKQHVKSNNENQKYSIEFKKPKSNDYFSKNWNDKMTLFGVIHNADVYDLRKNNNYKENFIITDVYDFDNWKLENRNYSNVLIEHINNNAYWQQESKHLEPYILYIPIEYSIDELWDLFKN